VEGGIEDDPVALKVGGQERELLRAALGGEKPAGFAAVSGSVCLLDGAHVEPTTPVGVLRITDSDRLKRRWSRCSKRWYWTPERASWKASKKSVRLVKVTKPVS
jgi:hypothetical protein